MTYLQATHRRGVNLLFAGVLAVLYHFILFLVPDAPNGEVINAVHGWIWGLLDIIPFIELFLLLGFAAATVYYLRLERKAEKKLRLRTFGLMFGESLVWGLFLFFNLAFLLLQIPGAEELLPKQAAAEAGRISFLHAVGLSLGAGFYEELFFRFLLMLGLLWVFKALGWPKMKTLQIVLAVVVSSLLFAAVHGDPPWGATTYWWAFAFRFLFGVLMYVLLRLRGFGITAWTHALYDVLIDIRTYTMD